MRGQTARLLSHSGSQSHVPKVMRRVGCREGLKNWSVVEESGVERWGIVYIL